MHQAYGVLGYPLGHSLSPYLHNQAFKKSGMDRCYFKWEIKPDQLSDFMRAVRVLPLSGVSVTIPYKEEVIPFLDEISPEARAMGAVNTVYLLNRGLGGTNTDYLGFMAPLKGLGFKSALVLGAGGAARSVLFGLKELGYNQVYLCNRNQDKARALAERFDSECVSWSERKNFSSDILVNATPLGTSGDNEDKTPWDFSELPFELVYDLVYNPLKTRLLRQAEDKGIATVSGLSMFVHQAREQFRIWTGETFDPQWAENILQEKLTAQS
ncbi:MAG: shikimate dehydrogenase [Desulfonatronovibrio sp.]